MLPRPSRPPGIPPRLNGDPLKTFTPNSQTYNLLTSQPNTRGSCKSLTLIHTQVIKCAHIVNKKQNILHENRFQFNDPLRVSP